MPQRLRDIDPSEVGLVVRGANRRRFSLLKAEDELALDEGFATVLTEKADGEEQLLEKLADVDAEAGRAAIAMYRLMKAHGDELPEEHPFRKAMDEMTGEAGDGKGDEPDEDDAIAKTADELDTEPVEKAKYSAEQRRAMAKSGGAMSDGSYPIDDKDDLEKAIHAVGRGKNNSHADIRAHIAKRAKALGATDLLPDSWNVSKEAPKMTDTATVPVKKEDGTWDLTGVPEEQRSSMEAFLKAQDEAHEAEVERIRKEADDQRSEVEKTAAAALAKADQIEDALKSREYVAKAEALGESGEEFGPVLKSIAAAVDAETFEKLESVIKANHERAVTAGIYEEIGKSGHGAGGSDAAAQLDVKADDIRKSDSSLTKEQALAKAYKDNPELYAQLRNEEG